MALFNNLVQVRIAISKTILDIYQNKLATQIAERFAYRDRDAYRDACQMHIAIVTEPRALIIIDI